MSDWNEEEQTPTIRGEVERAWSYPVADEVE
jgi:hypothetical protein